MVSHNLFAKTHYEFTSAFAHIFIQDFLI